MRIVVASRSRHKVDELRRMVEDLVVAGQLELLSLDEAEAELGVAVPEVVEDAPDFAGNARKKAEAVARATGAWALGDDSGLCVDALDGAPGVRSARFAGESGADRDPANNRKLLEVLEGVPDAERTASFVCALALIGPGEPPIEVEGRCHGRIGHAPQGSGGFGYDPLFVSLELPGDRTHAVLTPQEKDAVSHRGRALRQLLPEIRAVAAREQER